jgi:two-component sensor histidine kinase
MAKQFLDRADKDDPDQRAIARDLVSIELSHRIRNIFAIVSGLVALSARGRPEVRTFARDLQARFDALASAYRYASPQLAAPAPLAGSETVKGLLRILTAPYQGEGDNTIVLEGQDAPIGLQAAGTLALIVHELATNAVKHGALSSKMGTVTLSCAGMNGRYTIEWREDGGPRLSDPPHDGFGLAFSERLAASAQINIRRTWRPEGLVASISMPLEALGV